MGKKRAWNLLRLALQWARKGGIFKRGMVANLLRNYIKTLRTTAHDSITYGERQFSFGDTPMFNFKTHRPASLRFEYLPHIPCINPSVEFDIDDDDDAIYNWEDYEGSNIGDGLNESEEEGIDSKAEEFIARFYEQMKLQRQISYLQYNEMLQRGSS